MNPAAARTLGYEPQIAVERNLAEFLAPSVRGHFPKYLHRMRDQGQDSGYMRIVARNGAKHVWLYRNLVIRENGDPPYVVGHAMDVTEQTKAERETASTLNTLQRALAEVKTLTGLLPICAWCKRIRTESGQWAELESYVTEHSNANFSHGVCPKCLPKLRSNKEG